MDWDAIAARLRPDLEEIEGREAELLAQLAEVQADRKRLTKAMDALTASMKRPGRPRNGSKTPPWMPSDELRERVQACVENHPEGVTVKEVQEATEISHTGVDRTLRVLRHEEAIRLAGKRGTALLYKPQAERGAMNGGG